MIRGGWSARLIHVFSGATACCALTFATGCGDKETPVYPVTGKVTVAGKPAVGAQITLVPEKADEPARPIGTTDREGAFKLTSRAKDDGAPAGEYKVTVTLLKQVGNPDDGQTVSLLPAKYGKPELTPLKATVASGPTEIPAIDIPLR